MTESLQINKSFLQEEGLVKTVGRRGKGSLKNI